jgi:hypothetical protein
LRRFLVPSGMCLPLIDLQVTCSLLGCVCFVGDAAVQLVLSATELDEFNSPLWRSNAC